MYKTLSGDAKAKKNSSTSFEISNTGKDALLSSSRTSSVVVDDDDDSVNDSNDKSSSHTSDDVKQQDRSHINKHVTTASQSITTKETMFSKKPSSLNDGFKTKSVKAPYPFKSSVTRPSINNMPDGDLSQKQPQPNSIMPATSDLHTPSKFSTNSQSDIYSNQSNRITSGAPKASTQISQQSYDSKKTLPNTNKQNMNDIYRKAGLRPSVRASDPIPKIQSNSRIMNSFAQTTKAFEFPRAIQPIDINSSEWGNGVNIQELKRLETAPTKGITTAPKTNREQIAFVETANALDSLEELFNNLHDPVEEGDKDQSKLRFSDGIVHGLNVKLLPHQIVGVRFMYRRESKKIRHKGGFLCDDMGLGKTIQAIALILGRPFDQKRDKSIKATLVIAPLALIHQWAEEISEKAPGLKVLVHHGPNRNKTQEIFANYDVIITTFQIISTEHQGNGPLYQQEWHRIILDEAHTIKNSTTKMAIAARALEGKRRWCLTGTPIQNSVDDLQSLISFLRIGPYDNKETFKIQISNPISQGRGENAFKRLHAVLGVIMLRRTKAVLSKDGAFNLPARNVERVNLMFNRKEFEFYKKLETMAVKSIRDEDKSYIHVLLLLLRLRQACDHPKLIESIKDVTSQDSLLDNPAEDELSVIMNELSIDEKELSIFEHESSTKINSILKIFNDEPKRKTIIFSQFTSMMDLIEPILTDKKIKYARYDGSMSSKNREKSLNRLRNDEECIILLCSLKCGALGLNLTVASRVVIVDPWWNPMITEQAIDRVHRLGQTKDVNVYELVMKYTVEEKIMNLQKEKRELADAIIEKGGKFVASNRLTKTELLSLFNTSI